MSDTPESRDTFSDGTQSPSEDFSTTHPGDWRGVAREDDEPDRRGSLVLARRSRELLLNLARPRLRKTWIFLAIVIANNATFMLLPLCVAYGLDTGVTQAGLGDWSALILTTSALFAVLIANVGLNYASFTQSAALAQSMLYELRIRVFTHVQHLSVSFHERYTSGKIIARLGNDMDTLMEFLGSSIVDSLNGTLSLISMTAIMFWLDPPLAFIGIAGFIPMVVMTRRSSRLQRISQRRARRAIAGVITHYVDTMSGIRAVQSYRREHRNEEILSEVNAEYEHNVVSTTLNMGDYIGFSRLVDNFSTLAVLIVGGWRVIHGDTQVGVLAAFLMYLRNFYEPLETLAQVFNLYQSAASALEKISGLLEERPAVVEPEHPVIPAKNDGEIVLDQVTFSYSLQRPPVLPECSLTIPPGEIIALVGHTGAGKSTIAKLVARFYDPSSGVIRLDGVDLRDLADAELRSRIVMITQEPYMFSGTIMDNILIGKAHASVPEVHDAARAVGAHSFITALPQGYDTPVHKRGERLSAGERQLVAFVRVFLAAPKVIVLDEATASLDLPSERTVQEALRSLLKGRTAIIVAHRLSTVQIADRVLVMKEGRIVEDGSPHDLAQQSGPFAALHSTWKQSLASES